MVDYIMFGALKARPREASGSYCIIEVNSSYSRAKSRIASSVRLYL